MRSLARRFLWTLLFVFPLVVRLAYGLDIRDDSYMQWNLVVSYVNDDFARDIAAGGGPWTLHRSPWYPLVVSWVYRLLGGQPAMQMLQWVLGSAACVLVYVLARRLAGRSAALLSWAIASLYGPALFYEGELLEQACATFLLLAGLAALTDPAVRRVPWLMPAAGGALFGAAALLRPD
ncbi:MAG: hypothetical protein ACREAA_05000, partial [Candidatus Polarisedimenticolia bacterium]